MHRQLIALLDAARADQSASVVVACDPFVIELSFAHGRVMAHAGRDASKAPAPALSTEDEIVLQILGWQQREDRETFFRAWHEDTQSTGIADDVMRAVANAYQCDENDVELQLSLQPQLDVVAR